MRGVAAVAALLVLALPASARMHAGPGQLSAGHRLQGVIAPLDGGGGFAAPAEAYSLRRLKSTYTGPAVQLRRASDNAVQNIGFLGFTGFTGAPIDTAAAAAFCAATSCFVPTWYDQSGGGRDAVQADVPSQPTYVGNCGNGKPCIRATASGQRLTTAVVYTPVMPTTFSAVGNRAGGTGICIFTQQNTAGNQIYSFPGAADAWLVQGGVSGNIFVTAVDGAWHTVIGIVDPALGMISLDGAEAFGSMVASTVAGVFIVASGDAAPTTCSMEEAIKWDGYALTAAERTALTNNQRGFWGF